MTGIFVWAKEQKGKLMALIRLLLERMIRKFTFKLIQEKIPLNDKPLLNHIEKIRRKKKQLAKQHSLEKSHKYKEKKEEKKEEDEDMNMKDDDNQNELDIEELKDLDIPIISRLNNPPPPLLMKKKPSKELTFSIHL